MRRPVLPTTGAYQLKLPLPFTPSVAAAALPLNYRGRPPSGRAARSCRRELMPSLVNTLRRCHLTVRALRNSCAPISGSIGCLGRAGDLLLLGRELLAGLGAALAHLLPGGQQLAASTSSGSAHSRSTARRCSRWHRHDVVAGASV
jgi:hypothetical protein